MLLIQQFIAYLACYRQHDVCGKCVNFFCHLHRKPLAHYEMTDKYKGIKSLSTLFLTQCLMIRFAACPLLKMNQHRSKMENHLICFWKKLSVNLSMNSHNHCNNNVLQKCCQLYAALYTSSTERLRQVNVQQTALFWFYPVKNRLVFVFACMSLSTKYV